MNRAKLGDESHEICAILKALGSWATMMDGERQTPWLKAAAATYRLCRNASAGRPDVQMLFHEANVMEILVPHVEGLTKAAAMEEDRKRSQCDDEGIHPIASDRIASSICAELVIQPHHTMGQLRSGIFDA